MAEKQIVSQEEAEKTFEGSMGDFTKKIRENDFRGQAIYFLNAFWTEIGNKEAHNGKGEVATKRIKHVEKTGVRYEDVNLTWPMQIFEWVQLMSKLSHDSKGSNMHALDESGGARFLEIEGRAKTVLARRALLQEVDIDSDNHMSLFEWLLACEQLFDVKDTLFASKLSIQQRFYELMNRKQGTNERLNKAKAALAAVMEDIAAIERKLDKNFAILANAEAGLVTKRKAKNVIAQIQSNFPNVELNRKQITAEAAVRSALKGGADGVSGVLPGANWWLQYELEQVQKYKPRSA